MTADKPAPRDQSPATLTDQLDPISALLLTDLLGPTLPDSAEEKARVRLALDERLIRDFSHRLSLLPEAERKFLLENPGELDKKTDLYIREAARRYGARLFLSDFVMERVWKLTNEGGGPTLKNLLDLMHKAHMGKSGMPETYRIAKPYVIKELAWLKHRLDFAWPKTEEVSQFVAREIDAAAPPLLFYIKLNKAELLRFLEDGHIATAFRGNSPPSRNDLSPTQFYDRWIAFKTKRSSLESVRQDLTKHQSLEQSERKDRHRVRSGD